MNAVNDLLKEYIDLIHKRQRTILESGKETQTLLHCYRRADRVNCPANKTASDTLKQQLETIAVIKRSSNVSLILIAQD